MLKHYKAFLSNAVAITLLIVTSSFFIYHLKDLKILVSMTSLVDQSLPSSRNYRDLKEEFNLKSKLTYVLKKKNNKQWGSNQVNFLNSWIRQQRKISYIGGVTSPLTFYKPHFEEPEYILYYRMIDINDQELDFTKSLKSFNGSPWENIISSKRGDDFIVEVDMENAPEGNKFGDFNPKAFEEFLKKSTLELSEFFTTHITGTGVFTYYAFKGVQYNFLLNIAVIILLIVLFKVFFGTFKSGLLLVTSLVWVGLVVHGIMGYFQIPIEILSSGMFMMIAVSSIEDYFYILHENAKGLSPLESIRSLRVASFFTSLTTIIGFGSLYFSDLDIVARFGLMAAVGALLEWIAIFYFLPVFLKICDVRQLVSTKKPLLVLSKSWSRVIEKFTPNKTFGYLSFLIYPFSFFLLSTFQVSDSPLSLFPDDHIINKDFSVLKKSRGWETQAALVFSSDYSEKEQRIIIEKLREIKNIKHIETLFDTKEYLASNVPSKYSQAIYSDFDNSRLLTRYQSEDFSTRHFVYFKDTNFTVFKDSKEAIEKICSQKCQIIGEIVSYSEFMDKIPLGFIKSLGLSLFFVSVILLLLAFYFRFPNKFSFVLASLWGPSVLLVLMWIFQIKINFLSCVFITIMVGLTGDNAIQFLFAHGKKDVENGIQYHESCALQMGLLLSSLCLLFLFSYFAPPREFGALMALGFILSIYGDICLAKGFLPTSKKD